MTTIDDALLYARVNRPYYARILAALTPVPVKGLIGMGAIMGVDKYWRLYYDIDFIACRGPEEVGLLISDHEIQHLLRDHLKRGARSGADRNEWNIAADAEINDSEELLQHSHSLSLITPASLNAPNDLLAEEYLDYLNKMFFTSSECSCGSGAGGIPFKAELSSPDESGVNGVLPKEHDKIRDVVANDIVRYSRSGHNIHKKNLMWANEREKKPLVDWRRILSAYIRRMATTLAGRDDYSWSKISKYSFITDALFPGCIKTTLKIGLVVDTSASMSNDGPVVLGHIRSLISQYKVKCLACDVEPIPIKSNNNIKWTGGGGTDLRIAIHESEKYNDIVIVITDCETPWPDSCSKPCFVADVSGTGITPNWCVHINCKQ